VATQNVDVHVDLPSESFKLAMTVVTTGPIVFLYPYLQKYFIKGLTIGAVKG
jgi:putative aldouronate transport system permease protein